MSYGLMKYKFYVSLSTSMLRISDWAKSKAYQSRGISR